MILNSPDITPLLQPLRIGPLRLRNRFVMPGMQRFEGGGLRSEDRPRRGDTAVPPRGHRIPVRVMIPL